MSTMRCCSAWKVPIGTPNCLRVFRYSSVASQANFIAPTASAQTSAVAKSVTSSISAEPAFAAVRARARLEDEIRGAHFVERAIRFHFLLFREEQADAVAGLRGHHQLVGHRRAERRRPSRLRSSSHRRFARPGLDGREVVARALFGVRKGEPRLSLDDRRAGSHASARRCRARDELRADQRRQIGLDHQRLAERLHDAHQVDRAAAEAAVARTTNGRPVRPISAKVFHDRRTPALRRRRRSSCAPRSRSPWRGSAGPSRRAAAVLRCSRSS